MFAAILLSFTTAASTPVGLILTITAGVIMIPILTLAVECWTAGLRLAPRHLFTEAESRSYCLLIPAHNEATVIERTLKSVLPQVAEAQQIFVIADNCTDETAQIARNLGVTVLERHNLTQRGKGYALDYGLTALQENPPDVVVMVDADCTVAPNAIASLVQAAARSQRPTQAVYLMEKPSEPSVKSAISAFAFRVKNLVRPLGLKRLSQPCLLTGTGMAFPWQAIAAVNLASGNIVEDMQLGLDLAIAGYLPLFCEDAQVIGLLPTTTQAAEGQRKRWEHGHLQTLLTQMPRLLKASWQQKRMSLLALSLELAVPPLSLLVGVWGLCFALTGVAWSLHLVPLGLLLSITGQGLLLAMSIFWAWGNFGKQDIPLETLLKFPLYLLWKLPIYLQFLVKPQHQWNRTERE